MMAKKRLTKQQEQSDPQYLFQKWWLKTGLKQTEKMIVNYLKQNPDYDPDDDDGTDSGCVHRMMHEGEGEGMVYDASEVAFIQGLNNQDQDTDYLYCELDNIVNDAYGAGRKLGRNK